MPAVQKPAGPAPDRARLNEAALRHLSRFATTEAGLVQVLDRRVQRWARLAESEGVDAASAMPGARAAVRLVARALVEAGLIDDAAFAAARAARLARAGRSRRTVSAHLAAKGVDPALAREALPGPEQDLPVALAYAKRRRLGPYGAEPAPDDAAAPERHLRQLGALARAGFPRDVAERALRLSREEADAMVAALKRG